jgi:hypothetical protein
VLRSGCEQAQSLAQANATRQACLERVTQQQLSVAVCNLNPGAVSGFELKNAVGISGSDPWLRVHSHTRSSRCSRTISRAALNQVQPRPSYQEPKGTAQDYRQSTLLWPRHTETATTMSGSKIRYLQQQALALCLQDHELMPDLIKLAAKFRFEQIRSLQQKILEMPEFIGGGFELLSQLDRRGGRTHGVDQ